MKVVIDSIINFIFIESDLIEMFSWCDIYSIYIIYQVATWSDQMIRSPAPCIHSHCSIPLERMDDFYLSWYNWFLFAFVFSSWSIIMLICKINGLDGFSSAIFGLDCQYSDLRRTLSEDFLFDLYQTLTPSNYVYCIIIFPHSQETEK